MRAKELRIVFEDDEGQTYIHTYRPPSGCLLNAVAAIEAARAIGCAPPTGIGPALRKVTEVEGHHYDGCLESGETIIYPDEGATVRMKDLVPEAVSTMSMARNGERYRFRFDVTAVPVPEVKP